MSSFSAGQRLGHYEVISLIGSGGMGDVYRARDPRLGREVAVKTLRSTGSDARARLWREARAAASVSHPGVCQIHDVGETSDNIYIVMELLQGEPLAHRLKDGPLSVDEAIRVTLNILAHDETENLKRADEAFQRAATQSGPQRRAQSVYKLRGGIAGPRQGGDGAPADSNPVATDPEIFTGLVIACRFCGLLDASLAADRQARRLDPAVRTSVMYTHFMLGDWERAIASDTDALRWITNWTLPLLGRQDEAIASYLELESRPLPGTIRELMKACRLVLEGKREESYAIARTFFYKHFDPEGLYFTARVLARLGETDASLDLLDRIVEGGFYCSSVMLRDPWMDSIRGRSRFAEVVRRADSRTREAQDEFLRLNGDQLLALEA